MTQAFSVPRSRAKIIQRLDEPRGRNGSGWQILCAINGDFLITREQLCSLIGVDASPLSSSDPIVRDSFTQWFHRYLNTLRALIVERDQSFALIYPDAEDRDGNQTGGGKGIALIKAVNENAAAALLEHVSRRMSRSIEAAINAHSILIGDDHPYLENLPVRKRRQLRSILNGTRDALKGARAMSGLAMDTLFASLPELKQLPHIERTESDDD